MQRIALIVSLVLVAALVGCSSDSETETPTTAAAEDAVGEAKSTLGEAQRAAEETVDDLDRRGAEIVDGLTEE